MTAARCPICHTVIRPDADVRFKPFCSDRCRLLDLAKWLDGDYAIPGPAVDEHPDPDPDDRTR